MAGVMSILPASIAACRPAATLAASSASVSQIHRYRWVGGLPPPGMSTTRSRRAPVTPGTSATTCGTWMSLYQALNSLSLASSTGLVQTRNTDLAICSPQCRLSQCRSHTSLVLFLTSAMHAYIDQLTNIDPCVTLTRGTG